MPSPLTAESQSITSEPARTPSPAPVARAFTLASLARAMSDLYEARKDVCSRYVHSTSRGHEAIQLAAALQLGPRDFAYPYYRDDSMLLGIGLAPEELMAQLLGRASDPFSGGRTYYCHPSLRRAGMPTLPHQSSATGMQAIPATGCAHGLKYRQEQGLDTPLEGQPRPIVLCSIGDGAMTEGEVAEALQMAALHQLPIVYLVQDNEWAISATRAEARTGTAYDYAAGFPGLARLSCDGADFEASFQTMSHAVALARSGQPVLVNACCPLLGHHTSGVRREWYRTEQDLATHHEKDPLPVLRRQALQAGVQESELDQISLAANAQAAAALEATLAQPEPDPATALHHILAPTSVQAETGVRNPPGAARTYMVDAALHALEEIMLAHPEALFYGQDVGPQIGGVFREAAGLSAKFGTQRVFNTPIQEAYIIGSTAGMAAAGLRPIVEIQFADYFWPGMNQFVTELSKSCYLSQGQFPIASVIRVPIGAYGGGGPYHSGSIESALATIKGVKVVYPSNGADLKGLLKAAYLDPNPVVVLEHKGLYWSKVPGTEEARSPEPDAAYIVPIGLARQVLPADPTLLAQGRTIGIVAYGMGVHWATTAAKAFPGQVEVLDLRSISPLDEEAVTTLVIRHGKALFVTEEPVTNSLMQALAGRTTERCFAHLDAPIRICGSADVPAIPLNGNLEAAVLNSAIKVQQAISELLGE